MLGRRVFVSSISQSARSGARPWMVVLQQCLSTIPDEQDLVEVGQTFDDSTSSVVANSDGSEREPWKNLLEYPARASWRITGDIPKAVERALVHTLEAPLGGTKRKRKYLQGIYEQDIIAVQNDLARRRESERIRAMYPSRNGGNEEEQEKKFMGPVVYGRDQVLAAFYFRFLSNYAVTRRVLEEVQSFLGGTSVWKPSRVIDMGLGCGAASIACLDVLGGNESPVEWVHGIEPSVTMRQGAETFWKEYMRQQSPLTTPRLTFASHLSAAANDSSGFDVALFSYTATELPRNTSTLTAAALLWEKLAPNGVFVMIEPGTPDGFASIRTVRNLLLATNEPLKHENEAPGYFCKILAPCTHNGSCPIERFPRQEQESLRNENRKGAPADQQVDDVADEEDNLITRKGFCSFVQSMPSRDGRSKSEKFSYLVAQKRVSVEAEVYTKSSFAEDNLVELLERTHDYVDELDGEGYMHVAEETTKLEDRFMSSKEDELGLELVVSEGNRSSFGRIVSAPMKRRGHVLIESCVGPGTISRQKISRSMSKVAPGIYGAARKSRWGGLWPILSRFESK